MTVTQMSEKQKQQIQYICGRLYGLAGTVRYAMDDQLRTELKEIATTLANLST